MNGNRAVGLCLVPAGAVLAVLRPDPVRLIALATVGWDGPPTGASARRDLAAARRQLGLQRWCPVAVVVGPGSIVDDTSIASLLTGAGLAQTRVVALAEVTRLRSTVDIAVDPALATAATGRSAGLAIAAAVAALTPSAAPVRSLPETKPYVPPPAYVPPLAPIGVDKPQPQPQSRPRPVDTVAIDKEEYSSSWAVQPLAG